MSKHDDPQFSDLLTTDEVAHAFAVQRTRIKQLARDNALIVLRRDGHAYVPAEMIEEIPEEDLRALARAVRDDEDAVLPTHRPLWNLKGTITVLRDAGFSSEEIAAWLWQGNEELGLSPIQALRLGLHHRVNLIASTLGF